LIWRELLVQLNMAQSGITSSYDPDLKRYSRHDSVLSLSGIVRGTDPETRCFGAKVHQSSTSPTYIQLRLFGGDIADISVANAAHIYGKELRDSRFLSLTVVTSSIGAPTGIATPTFSAALPVLPGNP
jgi:hypothetical protein